MRQKAKLPNCTTETLIVRRVKIERFNYANKHDFTTTKNLKTFPQHSS